VTDVDRYLVLVEGGPPSNYSAWSPDVPGCGAAQGRAGLSLPKAEFGTRALDEFGVERHGHIVVTGGHPATVEREVPGFPRLDAGEGRRDQRSYGARAWS
jgi:hypothetical protein